MQRRLFTIGAVGLLSGCATIIKGNSENVSLTSEPSGAEVTITDETGAEVFRGTTPTTATLLKKAGYFEAKEYTVRVEKPGYQPAELELNPRVSLWYLLGNLPIGGLMGWLIVDPLTGAMWFYDPQDAKLTLVRDDGAAATPPTVERVREPGEMRLRVVQVDELPTGMRVTLRVRPL